MFSKFIISFNIELKEYSESKFKLVKIDQSKPKYWKGTDEAIMKKKVEFVIVILYILFN